MHTLKHTTDDLQLSHLYLILQLLFAASKQHLTLRWLESIKQMWNGADIVILREENELSIDEFGVVDSVFLRLSVVQECIFLNTV